MGAVEVRNAPEQQCGRGEQWMNTKGKQQLPSKDRFMKTTLRDLTVTWPLAVCLLLPALAHAETVVQAWAQRYNGLENGISLAKAMAVDGSNNVVVTGYSSGNGSDYDYATIKYSAAGMPLWTNRYNGPGNTNDQPAAVAVDGNGDVVVTGVSSGSKGYSDYATIKYSSAGVPLWTNRYHGPGNGNDGATAVAVDGSNNVIVTGYSTIGLPSYPFTDYATIKYSSAGVPLWTNRYNGPGGSVDQANAVAVDSSNNVIVAGLSTGSGMTGRNYTTIKYSSVGIPLWTNRYNYNGSGNPAYDEVKALAVDSSNNVIVTGYAGGETSEDHATIKYSSAGVALWTNRYNGPANGQDWANAVATDSSNKVIVTGFSDNGGGDWDYATVKYSSEGIPLWTNRYNGPGNGADDPVAVAVDASGNVIVAGLSVGSGSGVDYLMIKYSSAGVPLWTNRYNGPGNTDDYAMTMAQDHSGNIILTGYAIDSGGAGSFLTVKYICVPSPVMTGLPLTNGSLQLRVEDVLQSGTLVIEASSNLTGWAPVFTNTTPTNVLFYTDPEASSTPTRYYRAFQSP
jgi:uncharacterized delta-60 repeat protein